MKNIFNRRKDLIYSFFIFAISVIFVLSFFTHKGRPATFDAPFHVTNIAQFTVSLKAGDFPVYWENGFANYGLPIGIVAHQIPSYLGAGFNLILNNPTLSFNILTFLGIFLSALFFYYFLRLYFPAIPSFLAVFLFNFAPYRILNAYIRGAEPEIFSNIFLPLILISIYEFVVRKQFKWIFPFTLFISLLALTHPMNLLIYSSIFGPYILFCLWQSRESIREKAKEFAVLAIGGVLALGIAGYYLLPLNLELKYFYIGLTKNQLAPNQFLGLVNFFTERWAYGTAVDQFTRGNILQVGVIEAALFIFGIAYSGYLIFKRKKEYLFYVAVASGLLILFFASSFSNLIYQVFPILGDIQYPWRMLNAFIFIPPIIAAYVFSKKPNIILIGVFLIAIIFLRFPQLYGKNFIVYPDSIYYFNQKNVHSDLMTTIWANYSQNYPVKTKQYTIIGGQGTVSAHLSNSWRKYSIDARTEMQLLDYTFYFPGWKAYVDGAQVPIEFQDINYRGLIEYNVPPGKHTVLLKFEDTKVRLFGKLLTVFSFIIFLVLIFERKRLKQLIDKL